MTALPLTGLATEGPGATTARVAGRVERLREHQVAWAALRPEERAGWVVRYGEWLLAHQDGLQALLQEESGKPWGQVSAELTFVGFHLSYNARIAPRVLRDRRVRAHSPLVATARQLVRHAPYPVVGVISPWNFPVAITLLDSVPALLAGASVVVKPAEQTQRAVAAAIAGWREIGAPDVLDLVTGGPEVGAAVVDTVDYVQFTGSTATGRRIGVRCAERLVPCSLELGGKDPMLVLAGADLRRAVNAAVWGGLANSGQMCTSVERIYVHTDLYDDFLARLVPAVERLRVGVDDRRARYDVGPLTVPEQADLVREHLADAVARGARVLTGGTGDAQLVAPAVLVDVDHTMRCMTEETFGPLLPVMRVESDEQAVHWANASSYGLSAHVFGPATARTRELARGIEAGAVNVNGVATNLTALALPQQGWGESGIGSRMGGEQGILKYTRRQSVVESRLRIPREPTWFPYTPARTALFTHGLRTVNTWALRRLGSLRPAAGDGA